MILRSVSFILFLLLFLLAAVTAHAQSGAEEVDLELVLAVDVSRSMDLREQQLQRDGYSAAFRHPEVVAAIRSGLIGRIAVTYLEWAGPGSHSIVIPWTVLADADEAAAFAAKLDGESISRLRGTSISGALAYAASLFEASGVTGIRQVIDISGDGPNNMGPPVQAVRSRVLERGVTINGLPIMINDLYDGLYSIRDLDVYYEDCVIGGPGAFIITIDSSDRFAEAIRRKLVLEIAGREPAPMKAAFGDLRQEPRIDCMVGERMRERWFRE